MKRFFQTLLLFVLLLTIACSQAFQSGTEKPDFNTAAPEINITEEGYLTLAKTDLGKEFLLQASFIDQGGGLIPGSPTSLGLESRIIYFVEHNNSLFMMESPAGLLASDEFSSERILTEFRIIEENGETIIFDFNEGMKKIFIDSDISSSVAVQVPHSYLKEVKKEGAVIEIRQIAQVEVQKKSTFLIPVEVVYYLENYLPDPNFRPVEHPGLGRIGFIESSPFIRQGFGTSHNYIARWNLKKPIAFHISANTPKELVDTVREGVLYWNKVFGTELVQVSVAPEGITAPHPDYNMIQWVTNHNAQMAYTTLQLDPRTGEILYTPIYLTSVFLVPHLSDIDAMQKSEDESQGLSLSLRNFATNFFCEYPRTNSPANLEFLEKIDKTTALKMTKDYIRGVTAHEVGHALGLEHNFSASSSSKLTPAQISELFETYLQTGSVVVSEQVTSSVMDYIPFKEEVLNGRYIIQESSPPLSYDAMAIAFGYYSIEPTQTLEETLYCHDSLLEKGYSECKAFDESSHPLLASADNFINLAKKIPNNIAQRFLIAKIHFDPERRIPVGLVDLQAENYANTITNPLAKAVGMLQGQFHSLLVEKTHPPVSDFNLGERQRADTRWLDKGIAKGGGLPTILELIHQKMLYKNLLNAYERFVAIIEDPKYRSGETPFGEAYEFSDQEITVMKERTRPFFGLVVKKIVQQMTAILAGNRNEDSETPGAARYLAIADLKGLETTLGNWAEYIITDNAESEPTFDGELRLLATRILLPAQGPTDDWQKENRERVRRIFEEKLEARYGQSLNTIELDEIEKSILEILSQ